MFRAPDAWDVGPDETEEPLSCGFPEGTLESRGYVSGRVLGKGGFGSVVSVKSEWVTWAGGSRNRTPAQTKARGGRPGTVNFLSQSLQVLSTQSLHIFTFQRLHVFMQPRTGAQSFRTQP